MSGFFTMALGVAPVFVRGAWVWKLRPGGVTTPPATGSSLSLCRGFAAGAAEQAVPLSMADCVLFGAGPLRSAVGDGRVVSGALSRP